MDQLDCTTRQGQKIADPLAFTQIGFHNKAAFLLVFLALKYFCSRQTLRKGRSKFWREKKKNKCVLNFTGQSGVLACGWAREQRPPPLFPLRTQWWNLVCFSEAVAFGFNLINPSVAYFGLGLGSGRTFFFFLPIPQVCINRASQVSTCIYWITQLVHCPRISLRGLLASAFKNSKYALTENW